MAPTPVMDIDLEALKTEVLAPLAGAAPAGENARYDPLYDSVKMQIDKLTAMAAGEEGVDWAVVVDSSRQLLAAKTKDLNLAAYLCLGLFKVKAYQGLAAGLEMVLGLISAFWEDAFPPLKRMPARANLLNWIEERIGEVVADREPSVDENLAVHRCLELARNMAGEASARVSVPVTGFSGLRSALEKWVAEMPPLEEPSDEPESAPETGTNGVVQPASFSPATPTQVVSVEAPEKLENLDEGLDALRRLINLTRGLDSGSPLAYRLARVLKWDPITETPEADAQGKTQVPGPASEEMESLLLMARASNWKDLAEEAESLFLSGGTFSLDLQRLVYEALESLGNHAAARAVALETAALVARLEGIDGFSFGDDRPFADPATRQWLAEIELPGAGDSAGKTKSGSEEKWLNEALELAGRGELEKAMERLQAAVRKAPGRRLAMERRLAAAGLCLDYHQPDWAVVILEDLAMKLAETRLEEWIPDFFAKVYAGLVRGYQAQAEAGELDEDARLRLSEARRRLFDTDMALAVRLSKSLE